LTDTLPIGKVSSVSEEAAMRGGREAILKAAIEVFARKGYAAASIREICQTAGLTKPVLYYHFQSKEHLYQELMIDSFSYYRKNVLRASKAEGSLRAKLVNIMLSEFRATKEDPVRVRFLLRMVFSSEEEHPFYDYVSEMEKKRGILTEVLREGLEKGEASGDPREMATTLMASEFFATLENLYAGRPTLTRKKAEALVDVVLGRSSDE
jgi:AcrR family transcriptional regulator